MIESNKELGQFPPWIITTGPSISDELNFLGEIVDKHPNPHKKTQKQTPLEHTQNAYGLSFVLTFLLKIIPLF
jgi:hypothetical protein